MRKTFATLTERKLLLELKMIESILGVLFSVTGKVSSAHFAGNGKLLFAFQCGGR